MGEQPDLKSASTKLEEAQLALLGPGGNRTYSPNYTSKENPLVLPLPTAKPLPACRDTHSDTLTQKALVS